MSWTCECGVINDEGVETCDCGRDEQGKIGRTSERKVRVYDIYDRESQNSSAVSPQLSDNSEYHFKTLLTVGQFISVVGWILVGASLIIFFISFVEGLKQNNRLTSLLSLTSLLPSLIGILVVAYGQSIACFVSIERNTRRTYEFLKEKNKL